MLASSPDSRHHASDSERISFVDYINQPTSAGYYYRYYYRYGQKRYNTGQEYGVLYRRWYGMGVWVAVWAVWVVVW